MWLHSLICEAAKRGTISLFGQSFRPPTSCLTLMKNHAFLEGASQQLIVAQQRCADSSLAERDLCPAALLQASGPAAGSVEFVLDKSKFDVSLNLLALRVLKQQCGLASKILSGYLLDRPRVKHIVPDPSNSNKRLIILSECITDPSLCELPQDKLSVLKSTIEVEIVPHIVVLDYTHWPVEHILKQLLPAGCEVPSSFETIGHIAHLNLREELLPFRRVIAAVLLDKNLPKIKTIVNKVGTITNEFRVPTFEVLAGNPCLVTEVKQHGATFQLDYGLVYWNSRLEFEHKRLVSEFGHGKIVCDMFAGVGPFAIPAAQMGCTVYANDLNPDSVKYLQINKGINKVAGKVHTFNMDAREFMRQLMRYREENSFDSLNGKEASVRSGSVECCAANQDNKDQADEIPCSQPGGLQDGVQEENGHTGERNSKKVQMISVQQCEANAWEHVDHVIMNLPASALDFLDVFRGLLSKPHWRGSMPKVHCYCFMRANETIADVVQRAESKLNATIKNPSVWTVRDVAPNKIMLCLSFYLPEDIAFREDPMMESVGRCALVDGGEKVAMKRPRLDT